MWLSHCEREQAIYFTVKVSHGVLEYICVCVWEKECSLKECL